ncbi:MAG: Com family DNA-binding transcriptional regulator [Bacteroidetes bacterium]|nr:Com family DNA-binding transcriptional regulator [Bacteroidota bacterium]
MESIRCGNTRCRALLFKAADNAIADLIEIKCRRCGTINSLRPAPSPSPERHERRT